MECRSLWYSKYSTIWYSHCVVEYNFSDPNASNEGAAISVLGGSLSDPTDMPGLGKGEKVSKANKRSLIIALPLTQSSLLGTLRFSRLSKLSWGK